MYETRSLRKARTSSVRHSQWHGQSFLWINMSRKHFFRSWPKTGIFFQALFVFKLLEQGRINCLDDAFELYEPRFQVQNPFNQQKITIRWEMNPISRRWCSAAVSYLYPCISLCIVLPHGTRFKFLCCLIDLFNDPMELAIVATTKNRRKIKKPVIRFFSLFRQANFVAYFRPPPRGSLWCCLFI